MMIMVASSALAVEKLLCWESKSQGWLRGRIQRLFKCGREKFWARANLISKTDVRNKTPSPQVLLSLQVFSRSFSKMLVVFEDNYTTDFVLWRLRVTDCAYVEWTGNEQKLLPGRAEVGTLSVSNVGKDALNRQQSVRPRVTHNLLNAQSVTAGVWRKRWPPLCTFWGR